MNWQDAFTIALGFATGIGGWVLREIHGEVKTLREGQERFVRKDDYRADMADLKASLLRIETKLDDKADRP